MKFIRQHDETDCGIACLAMMASHYGSSLRLSTLRQLAGTDTDGTNLFGLATAAHRLGLKAVAVEGKSTDIQPSLQVPFIAHLQRQRSGKTYHHFVVVRRIGKKCISLLDPGKGRVRCPLAEFLEEWTGYVLLVWPDNEFKPSKDAGVSLLQFLPVLKPHIKDLVLVGLASFMLAALGIVASLYFRYVVDDVLFSGNAPTLHVLSVGMVLLTLFKALLDFVRSQIVLGVSTRVDYRLIFAYFRHVLALPLTFFESRKTGEILSRMEDAKNIRSVLSEGSVSMVMDSLMVVIIGVVLFMQASSLLWIATLTIPLSAGLVIIFSRLFRKTYKQLMEESADVQSCLVEVVAGIATVKALNAGEQVFSDYEKRQLKMARTSYMVSSKRALLRLLNGLIDGWGGNAIYWVGCYFILKDHMSLGQLMAFNALLSSFLGPLQRLLQQQPALQEAAVAAQRLGEILEMEEERPPEHSVRPSAFDGKISLHELKFRYGTRKLVLDIDQMAIEAGQWVALVGSSGCGKTSLVKLLLKFYVPESGEILLDNHNLLDIDAFVLRSRIGYVPQEIFLFSGTIAQNIALHCPEASLADIIAAAKKAQAHIFISELPDRYNTVLAERGSSLSGGERQRIALARALLGNPDLLIFDEATSNLDSISERELHQTLASLRSAKITTIMIAHRLSTIVQCDQIFVMDKGRIVERGRHEDLLQSRGYYAQLWHGTTV